MFHYQFDTYLALIQWTNFNWITRKQFYWDKHILLECSYLGKYKKIGLLLTAETNLAGWTSFGEKKQIFHFDLSCLISPFKWTKDTKDTNDTNVRQIDDQKTPILGVVHMPKQTQLNLIVSDLCFLWEIIVQKNWIIHWFLPGINYPRILQTSWLNLACSFLPSAKI